MLLLSSENEHIVSEVSAVLAGLRGVFSGFLLGKSILVETSGRLVCQTNTLEEVAGHTKKGDVWAVLARTCSQRVKVLGLPFGSTIAGKPKFSARFSLRIWRQLVKFVESSGYGRFRAREVWKLHSFPDLVIASLW